MANEACQGVMAWAKQQGFDFLTAMTHPHNVASQQLLVGLGFHKHGFLMQIKALMFSICIGLSFSKPLYLQAFSEATYVHLAKE